MLRPGECGGLTAGFVRRRHPPSLAFSAPLPRRQKAQFSSQSTKSGFSFPPPKPSPPPFHTHTLPGPVLAVLWGHGGFGGEEMGRKGGSQLGVQARKMGCGWMAGWPGGGKRGLGWGPAPRGQREAGRGGRSHALAPCRSVLSPGQGRTMGGLLLLGAWGGGSQAGGREGAKGGAEGDARPQCQAGPRPRSDPESRYPGRGAQEHQAQPWVQWDSPEGCRAGLPPSSIGQKPWGGAGTGKGGREMGQEPPSNPAPKPASPSCKIPHQNQRHHPATAPGRVRVRVWQQRWSQPEVSESLCTSRRRK